MVFYLFNYLFGGAHFTRRSITVTKNGNVNVIQFFFLKGSVSRTVRETHKKICGPNPKTFRVGPIHRKFSLRQAVLSHNTCRADPFLCRGAPPKEFKKYPNT